jgi:murein DD-endopeptidase MepM/ murein hydrolase activator NlpD
MHTGMDFTSPVGTEVYLLAMGLLPTWSMPNGGYGYNIIVDHGFGYKTRYAHWEKLLSNPDKKLGVAW